MKTEGQVPIDFGRENMLNGIQAALNHANAVHTNWSDQAYQFLKKYIESNTEFMAEDVRNASVGIVPQPPSLRAWGGVMRRAIMEGLISKAGIKTVKNIKAHRANANSYKSERVKHDRVYKNSDWRR